MTLQELTRLETSGTSELLCVRALPASLEGKAFTGISQTFFRPSANSTYLLATLPNIPYPRNPTHSIRFERAVPLIGVAYFCYFRLANK